MEYRSTTNESSQLRWFWGAFPWLLLVIIVILSVFIAVKIKTIAEERKAATKDDVPAVDVITLTMEAKQIKDIINLPAEVEPFEELWVKTEVPGQIVNVPAAEGQTVEKGQVLIEIDNRDYTSRIEQIEANYKLAELEHARIAGLAKKNIASSSDLDNIEAKLKALTAQLKEARLARERTKITAPISGFLNKISTDQGDWLGGGSPVAQILQMDNVKVVVGVPESDVVDVFDITEVDIVIEALDGLVVKGEKIFISRQPNGNARLYNMELKISNPEGKILPGMFARVQLVREVYQEAFTVPLYSVITQDKESFVYVQKDKEDKVFSEKRSVALGLLKKWGISAAPDINLEDKVITVAEKRSVTLGILKGWEVLVTSGLSLEEKVIIQGHRFLDSGQVINVVKNVNNIAEIL